VASRDNSQVTLLELTSAYVPFMNEGRPVRPYAAQIALNAKGNVIYRHDAVPMRAVLDARTLQTMRGMLRAVVTDGTGWQARLRNRWSAGKTGTTQGNRDAWFIGFTDRLATGVWFGNDDDSPMMGVWGADMPALAWRGFNEAIDAQSFSQSGVSPAFSSEQVARGVAVKPPLPRPAPEARHRQSGAFLQGDPMRMGR
jgi:membrane peptidoglycan carboxypeptidase